MRKVFASIMSAAGVGLAFPASATELSQQDCFKKANAILDNEGLKSPAMVITAIKVEKQLRYQTTPLSEPEVHRVVNAIYTAKDHWTKKSVSGQPYMDDETTQQRLRCATMVSRTLLGIR